MPTPFAMPDPTPEELRASQLDGLRQTLASVYAHVPHHRRAFDDAGVHPDQVTSLDDLAQFPFTTKEDLRQNYPFGMFAVPRDQVVRVHASSGTTGKPTVVGYTTADVAMWSDVVARSLYAAGARPGDVVHVAYGYGLFTGGLGAHYGAERLGCTVVPVSGGMTERQGPADRRLQAPGHHGDAVVLPGDPRRDGPPGGRPAQHRPRGRHLRRRAARRRSARRGRR